MIFDARLVWGPQTSLLWNLHQIFLCEPHQCTQSVPSYPILDFWRTVHCQRRVVSFEFSNKCVCVFGQPKSRLCDVLERCSMLWSCLREVTLDGTPHSSESRLSHLDVCVRQLVNNDHLNSMFFREPSTESHSEGFLWVCLTRIWAQQWWWNPLHHCDNQCEGGQGRLMRNFNLLGLLSFIVLSEISEIRPQRATNCTALRDKLGPVARCKWSSHPPCSTSYSGESRFFESTKKSEKSSSRSGGGVAPDPRTELCLGHGWWCGVGTLLLETLKH